MKVLHVSEPVTGGVWTYLRELGDRQIGHGHEPVLASPASDFDAFASVRLPGLSRRRFAVSLSSLHRDVASLATSLDVDLIHLHSGVAGLLRVFDLPVPAVYQPHSWSWHAQRVLREPLRWTETRLARRTDGFALVSDDELREGIELVGDRPSAVVSVGANLEHFRPPTDLERQAARAACGIDDGARVLVCVGRICRQKGQDRLVEAWSRLPPSARADRMLVLVGQLPGRNDLPATAGVVAVGDQADVRPWLWAADVCIQPSRWEGLSISVGEALATGLEVFASDCQGMAYAITDPGASMLSPAGRIVAQDDVDELLAVALDRLEPAGEADVVAGARARAEQLFAWDGVAKRIDTLYRDVLDRAR